VALQADLPCIRGEDVERLISRSEDELTTNPSGVFVADAAGVGTTAVVIGSHTPWRTHFGDRSRARHRGAGLIELTDSSLNRMRVDVDTVADVTHARVLGVGPATQTLLGAVAVTIRRPF
jgi:2-phospho-L-lactate guanylyltransferase